MMRPSTTHMRRRDFAAGIGLAALGASCGAAVAAPPALGRIVLGYTATLAFNGAFIAKDRGFFAQRGLDVELVLITLNSNIPGAMMGGSIQIGGPTPTVMLQANDGGLDLVVVSGCSGIDPANLTDGLLVRKGVAVTRPSDLIGKKIGVPGLNAYYHVLVRKWLADNKVDWRQVNFVEVPFTQSADVLRSGSVDAVATGEPFSQRIVADGIGTLMVTGTAMAPAGTPSLFYAATRLWAQANDAAVRGFRLAIADAVRFQADDPAGARAIAGKYFKLPPDVLAKVTLPLLQSEVTADQIRFWIDLMAQQNMIQERPDAARLLIP